MRFVRKSGKIRSEDVSIALLRTESQKPEVTFEAKGAMFLAEPHRLDQRGNVCAARGVIWDTVSLLVGQYPCDSFP